ncbi:MAG: DEAD/DEAH box helicase [Pseudomonadota bacterium]
MNAPVAAPNAPTSSSFSSFGLARPLMKALAAGGYETPTPIQLDAIPHVLDRRDLLGLAQTGTGKTAAFSLPLLHQLLTSTERADERGARALVLAPTRELASQIAQSMMGYAKFTPIKVTTVVGGVPLHKQARKLGKGTDVLIATPGRLIDLVEQGHLDLSSTRFLVLDEADQMMDMGFIHPLRRIAKMLPQKRQTLMFSATMPDAIGQLAKAFLKSPVRVSVTPAASPAEKVEQLALRVNANEKQALLTMLLKEKPADRVIVFTRTKRGADRMVRRLKASEIEAVAIHGDKTQGQRERALRLFKANDIGILIATDVAARGIDIPGVDHVINFDIPNVHEQYVHRIGRTARAGQSGRATALVSQAEMQDFRAIERLMDVRVPVGTLPPGLNEAVKALPQPEKKRRGPPNPPAGSAPGNPNGKRRAKSGRPNRPKTKPGSARRQTKAQHRPAGKTGSRTMPRKGASR